jgi:hypothetical protein
MGLAQGGRGMTKYEPHCAECGALISSDIFSADRMRMRFFAILRDIHGNLNDDLRRRFPSHETLRKHALIAVGWCDVMTVVAGSKAAAPGIAAALLSKDQYCLIDIRGDVLTMYTARSMSRRGLLKPQFLEVSEKVFAWIEAETGIDGRLSEAA